MSIGLTPTYDQEKDALEHGRRRRNRLHPGKPETFQGRDKAIRTMILKVMGFLRLKT